MENLRRLIEKKKSKGNEKTPRYGMRKLTVGLVSCMLGYMIFVSPVVVDAAEVKPEEENTIKVHSLEENLPKPDNVEVNELRENDEVIETNNVKTSTVDEKNSLVVSEEEENTDESSEVSELDKVSKENGINEESSSREDTEQGSLTVEETNQETQENKADEEEQEQENVALPTMYAVRSISDKAASGNTEHEMLGYAPNKKYNFQDLKFSPDDLSKNNRTTVANFEMYGKHNIAASTDNWKVNLQIDERLAKYITKIEVEPKRIAGASPQRIVFQRKNDTLGRSKNIWVANYIRNNNGIFAGGETTDTQTAHNGKIYFEKPVKDILAEIGDSQLRSDKLFYRIYLTSKQDKDKIVPGIDSTGFFKVQGIDKDNIENTVSTGNDWFKHASVESRYEKNPKIGSSNGAIVVDHKISKNTNLSYILSAKNKPWNLEYSVDPRLVKYIDGIELYKMGNATDVTPDFSFEGRSNKKVVDLSIDRRPNNSQYGKGYFTDNRLQDYVNFSDASPRPVIIRYVYKLNKPMEQILEELRNEAGVSEGEPFGDDFVFHAWLTDKTANALIPKTHGVGFYRVQDIDGDGKSDDEEVNNNQSPYIGKPQIKAPYSGDKKVKASVLLNENAGKGNTAQLINKNGEVVATINNLNAEENGVPKTIIKELEFNVDNPSKLGKVGDELTVRIIPSDPRFTKGEEAKATVKEAPKAVKEAIETTKDTDLADDSSIAKSGIANAAKMPEGTKYSWKTTPNTSELGEKTGVVLVTVPDRDEPFEVTVPVKVVQGFEVTVTNPPKQIEGQEVAPNTKVIEANEDGFTISGVHDEGNNSGLMIDENGNLSGTPNGFSWGDKDSNTYEEQDITLHAIVTSEDGNSTKNVEVTVTVQRDTDGDGTPDITDTDDDGDGIPDTEENEKGSNPKDPNSIPKNNSDTGSTDTSNTGNNSGSSDTNNPDNTGNSSDPNNSNTGKDDVNSSKANDNDNTSSLQNPNNNAGKIDVKKSNNSVNKLGNLPKTGDESQTGLYGILASLAASILLLLGIKKRKEEGNEQD